MTVFVVVCNVILAIACWFFVFKVCEFRRGVKNFRHSVLNAEDYCRYYLGQAPESILSFQTQSDQWRQQQEQWNREWQRYVLALQAWTRVLTLVQRFLRVYAQLQFRGRRSDSLR